MDRTIELDPGDPVLDPANAALERLEAGQGNPDLVVKIHSNGKFYAATLRREVEDVDPPAVFASPPKINVCAKRNPFRASPMIFHGFPFSRAIKLA